MKMHSLVGPPVRLLVACALCLGLAACSRSPSGQAVDRTEQDLGVFLQLLRKEFNPTNLLQWGSATLRRDGPAGRLPEEQWPNFITSNQGRFGRPSWILVKEDDRGKKVMVAIEYGGGFELKGIAIIPGDWDPSSSRKTRFIQWAPGVYVYRAP